LAVVAVLAIVLTVVWVLRPPVPPAQAPVSCVNNEQIFTDVLPGSTFYEATCWLVDQDLIDRPVINGHSGLPNFNPGQHLTRADAATLLYQLAGTPTVASAASPPFDDVNSQTPDHQAIAWLVDEGIVSAGGRFQPNLVTDRAEWSMWLWTYYGQPSVDLPPQSPFDDVRPTDRAYPAICWLTEQGVVSGSTGQQSYRPAQPLTRGTAAVFLFRLA
jgi:hypothetical protein